MDRCSAAPRFLPSFRTWPHRDGGRVVQLYGDTWKLEVSWAHRRRDRYGVRIGGLMSAESQSARDPSPEILDACCGGRMWWWDKAHPLAVYMDKRSVGRQTREVLPVNPGWECRPDMLADFRDMPFDDELFQLVVFDPPHNVRREINGRMSIQYGSLHPETYPDDLRRGFAECWRVLAPGGTLVFKWAGPRSRVEHHFPVSPIVGTRSSRGGTQWFIFYKPLNEVGPLRLSYGGIFPDVEERYQKLRGEAT